MVPIIQLRIQDFPEERASTIKMGRQSIILSNFPQKLHESEKKVDPEIGAHPWHPPWIQQWIFSRGIAMPLICFQIKWRHLIILYEWRRLFVMLQ